MIPTRETEFSAVSAVNEVKRLGEADSSKSRATGAAENVVVLQKRFEVIKFSRTKIIYATTPKMSAIKLT
ncbi:hypothetical protein, partial [Nostoc sp. MG11]|uniref:hypothetical protein n=1 Tax=Nostoc sp. MG11 TaxID=2721166 RepID=UPI001D01F0B0